MATKTIIKTVKKTTARKKGVTKEMQALMGGVLPEAKQKPKEEPKVQPKEEPKKEEVKEVPKKEIKEEPKEEPKEEIQEEIKIEPKKKGFFSSFSKKDKEVSKSTKDKKQIESSKEKMVEEKVTISEPVKATPAPQRKIPEQRRLSTFGLGKQRDLFIQNLSMLVLSGMTIINAISSIIRQTKNAQMKKILERILLKLKRGQLSGDHLIGQDFLRGTLFHLFVLEKNQEISLRI